MLAFLIATFVSSICVAYSFRALRATWLATSMNGVRVARSLGIGDATRVREKVTLLRAWAEARAGGGASSSGHRAAEDQAAPGADVEAELFAAALDHRGEDRVALVNTALGEVDHRVHQQARIPRVCTRVSSTVGLLCGAMALRQGLVEGSLDVTPMELFTKGPIADMLAAVLMGIAGAIWCAAAAKEQRAAAKEKLEAVDALVEKLEAL